MNNRTNQKILATVLFYLLFIVLGTFGYLPSPFFRSEMGQSHSIFSPISALLDIFLYVFITFVLVTVIFDVIGGYFRKK